MEFPKIKQAIFIVNKHASYKFDVNSSITIKNLKRMLIAAANLGKTGLRIFHQKVELTDKDDHNLDELLPPMSSYEFHISTDEDQRDESINIRLGAYCHTHEYKYPYFYCYDCSKSICSMCLTSVEHRGHSFIEKYDYLRNSRDLIDGIFSEMNIVIHGAKTEQKTEFDELKKKVRNLIIPQLNDFCNKIGNRMLELVDCCFDEFQSSTKNVQQNVDLLKVLCSDGLEKLKSEIAIEDMMLDEEIFLTFDRKFKDLLNFQKVRIEKDSKRYQALNSSFKGFFTNLDGYYRGILDFLDGCVNHKLFIDAKAQVKEHHVSVVHKEEIDSRLFPPTDVKPKYIRSFSSVKKAKVPQSPINGEYGGNRVITGGFKIDTPLDTSGPSGVIGNIFSTNGNYNGHLNGNQLGHHTQKIEETINVVGGSDDYLMMSCIPGTKELLQYNNSSGTVDRKAVHFPTLSSGLFLKNCAWVNHEGKLYITGGESNGIPSSQFLCYDFRTDELYRLPDMLTTRHSHSLLSDGDFIYAIGGFNLGSCEKYDIRAMRWTKLSNLQYDRSNTVLHIHKGYLYSFFGVRNGVFMDTIERLNLKNDKAKWETVACKNPGIDLKLMGCGIVQVGDNEIFLFGGKKADGIKKDLLKFNLKNFTFAHLGQLEDEVFFQESHLLPIGEKTYAQFSLGRTDHFFKAQIL
jgi:hypothetical protein